jgi:hypothetical protein
MGTEHVMIRQLLQPMVLLRRLISIQINSWKAAVSAIIVKDSAICMDTGKDMTDTGMVATDVKVLGYLKRVQQMTPFLIFKNFYSRISVNPDILINQARN